MTFSNTYVTPVVVDFASPAAATAALLALRQLTVVTSYSPQVFICDVNGNPTIDITQYLLEDPQSSVTYDSTADVPGDVTFSISKNALNLITWGRTRIQVYALVRSANYNASKGYDPSTYLRFPLGQYIVTTPGFDDLDQNDFYTVTGYGVSYLLQKSPTDSFAFDAGTTYKAAIEALFNGAGYGITTGNPLSNYVDFSGDWAAKTLSDPVDYPLGSETDYLAPINDLLKASGQRPFYAGPTGRWIIDAIPKMLSQPLRWTFAGTTDPTVSTTDLNNRTVLRHQSKYNGDVYKQPNRYVFVQNSLTFTPIEGSGQYTVNVVNTPPAGQAQVNRIVPLVVMLDASGQTDLVTQGDAYVADALAAIETVDLQTTPWPVAGHYDIFRYVHASLPVASGRRLQAQTWKYYLWGAPMEWTTKAVNIE